MRTHRLLSVLLLLLIALVSCRSVECSRTVPLRVMERADQTIAFVPVSIAGERPFLFALDTGASSTVLSTEIASSLNLPRTGEQRRVTGVVGAETEQVVRVEDWSVGDVHLSSAEVVAIDLPKPNSEGLQGLLGSEVLSRFGEVVVDYGRQELRLPQDASG